MTNRAWRPVLDGSLAARARATVAEIAAELDRRDLPTASLADGLAGIALFHGYRARAGEAADDDATFRTLERALAQIAELSSPWLFTGYAGIGFAIQHLADVVGDTAETLAQLDDLVVQTLRAEPWAYEWELMCGAIGLGVYGLERGDHAIVARVVDILEARAEPMAVGRAWRAFDDQDDRVGHFNLGMAHGVAGVVGFLAEACTVAPRGAPLLRAAVDWLRTNERVGHARAYPGFAAPRVASRATDGWCYGDQPTALALMRAGRALGDVALVDAAAGIARRAARRTGDELATLYITTALCHGSIGQALLFHRLGETLDDDDVRACARAWYARALDELASVTEAGLQGGLAGVGLGLIAGYSVVEPTWMRMLLC
ncbi:MAG: hypothetical protein K8W52_22470 [Deltaproteobacteria bacterium]|nr:hypothetical protein [Deltaproteobacteria bacterium]